MDNSIKTNTLFELNAIEKDDQETLFDTSGNSNLGILIGDFKIEKLGKDIESMRDTVIDKPKIVEKDGPL